MKSTNRNDSRSQTAAYIYWKHKQTDKGKEEKNHFSLGVWRQASIYRIWRVSTYADGLATKFREPRINTCVLRGVRVRESVKIITNARDRNPPLLPQCRFRNLQAQAPPFVTGMLPQATRLRLLPLHQESGPVLAPTVTLSQRHLETSTLLPLPRGSRSAGPGRKS